MRIILYGYEYPPLGGGVANALKFILAEYGKQKKVHVDFVTTSLTNEFEIEKINAQVTMHKLPIGARDHADYHKQKPAHMIKYTWAAYFYTWRLIFESKQKFDLTHFFGFPGGLVSLLFRWKWPYIISLRGVDVPGYNPRFNKFMWFYKPLSWLIWVFAHRVVTNSLKLTELAKQTAPNLKFIEINNGIDTDLFKPVSTKYHKFTVTAGGTLFGQKKGLEFLIRGFAKFHDKHPDTQLHLIGSGDMQPTYEAIIRELKKEQSILILGRKSQEWIAAELPKFSVYCLPSLNEGMSNSALEALASGLPLLLTQTGGTDELLEDGVNGFVIEKQSADDIAGKLETLYADQSLREKMGEASRNRAGNFEWGVSAEKYLKLYKEII